MNEDFIKIIRDSLEYNPLNGEFKWKKRLSNRINIGDVAGSIHKKGYVIISLKRILRTKSTDSRKLDYEKIIHICKERIRQIELGLE